MKTVWIKGTYGNPLTVSVIGNKKGIYINPCTRHAYMCVADLFKRLPRAEARKLVQFDGVDHVCVDIDVYGSYHLFQFSGWNKEDGRYAYLLDERGRIVK